MDTASINTVIALVGLVVALIVNALAVFRYIAGVRDAVTERIYSESEKLNTRIDSVSRETRLLIDKVAESEAKSRADIANTVSFNIGDARRDAKTLEEKFHILQRDVITRPDLAELRSEISQLRHELTAAIDRQERNRNEALDKLEKRVELIIRTGAPA